MSALCTYQRKSNPVNSFNFWTHPQLSEDKKNRSDEKYGSGLGLGLGYQGGLCALRFPLGHELLIRGRYTYAIDDEIFCGPS